MKVTLPHFSDDETFQLIHFCEKHEFLYNPKHKNYKNNNLKTSMFTKFLDNNPVLKKKFTAAHIKEKFRRLRTSFTANKKRYEVRKQLLKQQRSGQGAEDYIEDLEEEETSATKEWPFFQSLMYLDVDTKTPSKNSLDLNDEDENEENENDSNTADDDNDNAENLENENEEQESDQSKEVYEDEEYLDDVQEEDNYVRYINENSPTGRIDNTIEKQTSKRRPTTSASLSKSQYIMNTSTTHPTMSPPSSESRYINHSNSRRAGIYPPGPGSNFGIPSAPGPPNFGLPSAPGPSNFGLPSAPGPSNFGYHVYSPGIPYEFGSIQGPPGNHQYNENSYRYPNPRFLQQRSPEERYFQQHQGDNYSPYTESTKRSLHPEDHDNGRKKTASKLPTKKPEKPVTAKTPHKNNAETTKNSIKDVIAKASEALERRNDTQISHYAQTFNDVINRMDPQYRPIFFTEVMNLSMRYLSSK